MKWRISLRIRAGLLLLFVTCAALLMLMLSSAQPGYVLIAFSHFRYESSLWFFLALLAALWLAFWLLRLAIRTLLVAGGWLNPWSKHARIRRALRAQQLGMLAFAEGHFARALPRLERAASSSPQPLLPLLTAARAAQQLGNDEQSTALLEQARQQCPGQNLAIDLLKAELHCRRGEWNSARETLQHLHQQYPGHLHLLRQLQRVLEQQKDWLTLQPLLPKLQKHGLLTDSKRLECEQQAACLRLEQADALPALNNVWRELPKALRRQTPVLVCYAGQLARLDAADHAAQLLHRAIKRHYDSRLVACYGKLPTSSPEQSLKTAESWLGAHPEDAGLQLALARLARANGFFDKARSYYESSFSREPDQQTCTELAQLLLEMGESQRSARLFAQALIPATPTEALSNRKKTFI